jgi:hypothetical protein
VKVVPVLNVPGELNSRVPTCASNVPALLVTLASALNALVPAVTDLMTVPAFTNVGADASPRTTLALA